MATDASSELGLGELFAPDRIFACIRRLPHVERPAALRAMCAGDDALHDELLQMLRLECGDTAVPALPASAPAPSYFEPGDVIAERYAVVDVLGMGATSTVYHAFDTTMRREVALKVFDRPRVRGVLPAVVAEAQATARVDSDFVVKVHGASGMADPVAYIDLELCRESGENARALSDFAPPSLTKTVLWLEQVARGLHDAHERGVFHRDVKPANLLVVGVDGRQRAKVTDFGLAAARLEAEAAPTHRGEQETQTLFRVDGGGHVAGTPAYMSPEQAHGIERPLDPGVEADQRILRCMDVYSLGATAFELLAGEPPYRPRDDAAANARALDVIEQVRLGPPVPLSRRRCRWRVPIRLQRIVAQAMERRPAARYASTLDLARDLRAFRSHRPTSHDRRRYHVRLGLLIRRNLPAFIGCVILLGAVVAAVASGRYAMEKRREADAAEVARRASDAGRDASERRVRLAEAATDAAVGDRDRRVGLAEAARVAAIRDRDQRVAVAEAARADAIRDRDQRVEAADTARTAAETARTAAETARTAAEAVRDEAVRDRDERVGAAAAARAAAEHKALVAERAREAAVADRDERVGAAERARAAAEQATHDVEGALAAAVRDRDEQVAAAEQARDMAEQRARDAEAARAAAEQALVDADGPYASDASSVEAPILMRSSGSAGE